MQLLGIAVHAHVDASGVDPSATIATRSDVVEVAHDVVAQVVLQVLSRTGVAGLGARPEAVEVERFLFEVEAQPVEVVVPVGVFDDDLHLRVHGLRRVHHQLATGVGHETESVFCPTFCAFGGYLIVIFQVDEEKVVEDDVIKKTGCVL